MYDEGTGNAYSTLPGHRGRIAAKRKRLKAMKTVGSWAKSYFDVVTFRSRVMGTTGWTSYPVTSAALRQQEQETPEHEHSLLQPRRGNSGELTIFHKRAIQMPSCKVGESVPYKNFNEKVQDCEHRLRGDSIGQSTPFARTTPLVSGR